MAADPRYRLFVVFVPLPARNNTPPTVFYRERQSLVQQLNSLLGPDDLVAVMTSDMRVDELTFERSLTFSTDAWPTQSKDPRYALWDACYPSSFPGSPNGEMKGRYQELMTFEALDALIAHLGGLRDERKHVLVLTMRNYLDKRATCRCGWESSRKDRRVEATMAWETHAGLREDPDTAVTR